MGAKSATSQAPAEPGAGDVKDPRPSADLSSGGPSGADPTSDDGRAGAATPENGRMPEETTTTDYYDELVDDPTIPKADLLLGHPEKTPDEIAEINLDPDRFDSDVQAVIQTARH